MSYRRERARAEWEALAIGVLVAAWRWRLELLTLALLAVVERGLAGRIGNVAAMGAVIVGGVMALAVPAARRFVVARLHVARVRRAWECAVVDAGLGPLPWRCPRVLRVMRLPVGHVLRVRVARGEAVSAIEARAEQL